MLDICLEDSGFFSVALLTEQRMAKRITVNPQWLHGPWNAGWALDVHTLSSHPLLTGGFDTARTEIGELLYRLKYRDEWDALGPLADAAADFLRTRIILRDLFAIVPAPPSTDRLRQPVAELAEQIGQRVNLPVMADYLEKTRRTPPLKNVHDSESRQQLLKGSFRIKEQSLSGQRILLFDDLFRSGETLGELTRVSLEQGRVERVYVLTLTRTRSNR